MRGTLNAGTGEENEKILGYRGILAGLGKSHNNFF
jgi:hypothetical protein